MKLRLNSRSLTPATVFLVLLAFTFNPFPLDREVYSTTPGSPIATLGQYVFVAFAALTGISFIFGFATGRRKISLRSIKLNSSLILLMCLAGASVLWSVDAGKSLYQAGAQIASLLTIAILTSRIDSAERLVALLSGAIFTTLIISLIGVAILPERAIHHPGAGIQLSADLGGLWKGAFIHKNYAAGFLMIGACISGMRLLQRKNIKFHLVSLSLTAVFIWFSGSLSALLAPLVGLVLTTAFYLTRRIPAFTKLLAVMLLGAMLALPATFAFYVYPETGFTADGRAHIWSANWRLWETSPILGQGFQAVYSGQTQLWLFDNFGFASRLGSHSHNGFMEAFGQLGILGAGLVAVFLYQAVISVVRLTKNEEQKSAAVVLLLCLTTALVRANFEPDFISHRIHWYVIVLIAITSVRIAASASAKNFLPEKTRRPVAREVPSGLPQGQYAL